MLARLKSKVSEEVINEITPATIKPAQEKLYQEKQRRFRESYKPIKNYGYGIYNAKAATPKYKAIGEPMNRVIRANLAALKIGGLINQKGATIKCKFLLT
jgi:hypothetical protein